jgi:hypothetical protein
MSRDCTPAEPLVVTATLPEANMFSRSPALSTAFVAVGVQVPPAQFMFCVAAVEIVTAALADADAKIAAKAVSAARLLLIFPTF